MKAWAVETGRLVGTFTGRDPMPTGESVTAIAALPLKTADGIATLLLARAGGPENAVQLWRAGGPPAEAVPPLTGHLKRVRVLAFSPDGKLLASGSDDGAIKLWDAEDGSLQRTLKGYAMPVNTSVYRANMDDKARPDLLRALSARLAYAMEGSDHWELHGDHVKRMTGGDPLVARAIVPTSWLNESRTLPH